MWAAHKGHSETCKYLLKCGAKVDLQDKVCAAICRLSRVKEAGHEKVVPRFYLEVRVHVSMLQGY